MKSRESLGLFEIHLPYHSRMLCLFPIALRATLCFTVIPHCSVIYSKTAFLSS